MHIKSLCDKLGILLVGLGAGIVISNSAHRVLHGVEHYMEFFFIGLLISVSGICLQVFNSIR